MSRMQLGVALAAHVDTRTASIAASDVALGRRAIIKSSLFLRRGACSSHAKGFVRERSSRIEVVKAALRRRSRPELLVKVCGSALVWSLESSISCDMCNRIGHA